MSHTEPLDPAAITAAELDGREYPLRPTAEEQERWKEAGLFVIVAVNDDVIETAGLDVYEISSRDDDRIEFGLRASGAVRSFLDLLDDVVLDDDEDAASAVTSWLAARKNSVKVTAEWSPPSGESWLITAGGIGHHFDIMEAGGEVFCRGLVLSVADLPTGEAKP